MGFNSVWAAVLVSLAILFPVVDAVAQGSEFHKHVASGDLAKVRATIGAGKINLEKRDKRGDTAVIVAARTGNLKMLQLLVKSGAKINAFDRKRRDVLNIAITTKNPALARVALELGADPTLVTSVYDGSAVIYGSAKGAVEIVEMLLKAGAPVNRVNNLGWTALLEVAILGDGSEPYIRIAKMLIKAGANKTLADRDDKTPFDHATMRGHKKLASVLALP